MRVFERVLVLLAMALLVPIPARAQEQRPVGLTVAAPTAIGVIWHVSDRIAIRPEFSFTKTSSEFETPIGVTESSAHSVSVGASGLFYVRRWDNLSAYLTPRLLYTRMKSETTVSVLTPNSEGIGSGFSIIGSFGAQYSLSSRFGVFGELGFGYSNQESSSNSLSESRAHSWATRTGVGVNFYF